MRQAILLQLQFDRSHVVELLGYRSITAQHLKLQVGVRQHNNRFSGLNQGAVFNENFVYPSTFYCVEVHRAFGYQPASKRNEVFESANRDLRDSDALRIYGKRATPRYRVNNPPGEKQNNDTTGTRAKLFRPRHLSRHLAIHAGARHTDAGRLPAWGNFPDFTHFDVL